MITLKTAQRITEVYTEIEECKQALKILKDNNCESPTITVIPKISKKNDDGVCVLLSHISAAKIIKETYDELIEEYRKLNEKAHEESKKK